MADEASNGPGRKQRHLVGENWLTLLTEGPERLDALLDLIEEARSNLRILYYIFKEDEAGLKVRDALLRACSRGVSIAILVDGFGTEFNQRFLGPLVENGCHFCRFAPRWGRRYLLRNHQKLAVADDNKAIIGGFNVAKDYFGTVEEGAWRDLGLMMEGPDVIGLAHYFDSIFNWASRERARTRDLRRMLNQYSAGDGKFRWLFGGPARRLSPWARSVKDDMLRASRLDMVAAYFAPSRNMLRRISDIGRRGKARIVTAAKSDNAATIGAARHTYWRLLKRGVEIYEYEPTKLHTKLIVVDDAVYVGSANFDMRSLYLNLEMMLRIEDRAFAAAIRRYVDGEASQSRHISQDGHAAQRTFLNRFLWAMAYFLVATMDYNVSRRLNFGLEGR